MGHAMIQIVKQTDIKLTDTCSSFVHRRTSRNGKSHTHKTDGYPDTQGIHNAKQINGRKAHKEEKTRERTEATESPSPPAKDS